MKEATGRAKDRIPSILRQAVVRGTEANQRVTLWRPCWSLRLVPPACVRALGPLPDGHPRPFAGVLSMGSLLLRIDDDPPLGAPAQDVVADHH